MNCGTYDPATAPAGCYGFTGFGQASPLPSDWFYLWMHPFPDAPWTFGGYFWGTYLQAGRLLASLRTVDVTAWRITDRNNLDVVPVGAPQFTPPIIPPFSLPGYAAALSPWLPWNQPGGTAEPPFWAKT